MDPHEDYVAVLARYRSMARRIEAGELRTRELLARSEQRVRLSRELLASPVPTPGRTAGQYAARQKVQTD